MLLYQEEMGCKELQLASSSFKPKPVVIIRVRLNAKLM